MNHFVRDILNKGWRIGANIFAEESTSEGAAAIGCKRLLQIPVVLSRAYGSLLHVEERVGLILYNSPVKINPGCSYCSSMPR